MTMLQAILKKRFSVKMLDFRLLLMARGLLNHEGLTIIFDSSTFFEMIYILKKSRHNFVKGFLKGVAVTTLLSLYVYQINWNSVLYNNL